MKLLYYPDDRLKQASRPVTEFDAELQEFVKELEVFMRKQPGGVGIAAPQVGVFKRLVLVDASKRKNTKSNGFMALINPEITEHTEFALGREGCMSVPDFTGNVIRAKKISYTAFDQFGRQHNYSSVDYEARVVQHELDHLDGLLFLDRLVSRRTDLFKRRTS